ncbi:MAG: SDR family oxidoreductase [Anaerolineales bacterium]|nr:SDR family oxidoreductase [Anaerolineales bacterium]MCL4260740.1 SDR family oxidoreductase [Anaerolineales bacterium]
MSLINLKGQVVIVTGASSGIGEATARRFGREGAKVVLAARRIDRLETLAKEIEEMGSGAEAFALQTDLSKLEDCQTLIQRTLERFGRVDILINNAGFGRLDWLENLDPLKDIQAQFAVNAMGVIQTTRQALPAMIRQRSGHIIQMCSMAGLVGTPTYTIYSASKHAVHGFSEALRREVKPWGIEVSMAYPGGVATEFADHAGIKRKTKATTPKFMVLTAEQVADAVVNLARRPRAMRIIPWLWLFTVWLNRSLNWLVDYMTIHRFTIPEREEELKTTSRANR